MDEVLVLKSPLDMHRAKRYYKGRIALLTPPTRVPIKFFDVNKLIDFPVPWALWGFDIMGMLIRDEAEIDLCRVNWLQSGDISEKGTFSSHMSGFPNTGMNSICDGNVSLVEITRVSEAVRKKDYEKLFVDAAMKLINRFYSTVFNADLGGWLAALDPMLWANGYAAKDLTTYKKYLKYYSKLDLDDVVSLIAKTPAEDVKLSEWLDDFSGW